MNIDRSSLHDITHTGDRTPHNKAAREFAASIPQLDAAAAEALDTMGAQLVAEMVELTRRHYDPAPAVALFRATLPPGDWTQAADSVLRDMILRLANL